MKNMKRVPYVLAFLPLLASPGLSTWSIVVANKATGEVGVASATCLEFFNLQSGAGVIVVGKGAAQAQASVDPGANRIAMFYLMQQGYSATQVLQILQISDPALPIHQYGIATLEGPVAATFTGNQTFAYANGVAGQVGPIAYAIQGNILTCQAVIDAAEDALVTTSGDLGQKLMAAMQAARSFGGDGRCSCSKSNPTCGCPPPSFAKSAHIGYVTIARIGDVDGTCSGGTGCANGTYYLNLNVIAGASSPDPVDLLQGMYDTWRAGRVGHADAILSQASVAPNTLSSGSPGSATLELALADLDGTPLSTGGASITVTHDAGSAGLSTIGTPVDHGDGTYSIPLSVAGTTTGKDVFRVVVDDGVGPVTLYPLPALAVQVPGPLLREFAGFLSGEAFGSAVSSVGDLDGDGASEILVGAAEGHIGGMEGIGRARVFSGATGELVVQIEGTAFEEHFGSAVAPLGGGEGDGAPAFSVGAPGCASAGCPPSYVRVVSGADGSTLVTVNGADPLERFGASLARLGDVSGDGVPDFVAGAPDAAGGGRVAVHSGADGSLLLEIAGASPGDEFGHAVARLGDLDGDGIPEIAVGAPGFDAPGKPDAGRATIHSGSSGATIREITGKHAGDRLGSSLANAGKVNADALDDLLVGIPFADVGNLADAGEAVVFSGKNGASLRLLEGSVAGGLFGSSVAGLGDVNGDGRGEVAVGAPGAAPGGRVLVFSAANGVLLLTHDGLPGDLAGTSVASAGDVDGDGILDLVLGAPGADAGTGRARVFSLAGLGGALSTKQRGRVALQRDLAEPDPDGRGTAEIRIRGDEQSFLVDARSLPADPGSSFAVLVEDEPGGGVFTALGTMTLLQPAQGRWGFGLEGTGTAPAGFNLPSLAAAAGRRVEVRDASTGTVYLWGELPVTTGGENVSRKGDLSPTGTTPGASGSVRIRFKASKGVSRLDVRAKGLASFATYGVRIEDPLGSGTFVDVATLEKGRLRRDTAKGDPLPLGVSTVESLSGRAIQVREGSLVHLEGVIP